MKAVKYFADRPKIRSKSCKNFGSFIQFIIILVKKKINKNESKFKK